MPIPSKNAIDTTGARKRYNVAMDEREEHEEFMAQALLAAEAGRGNVEPNPMVGAVLVRDGVELGRGWHVRFGGPHAEIEALRAAQAAGHDARGATMYVTLEPCCHRGKTPPCTDAIIQAGIAKVVVAMTDPDENVSGGGIATLRRAGIDVVTGVLEGCARRLGAAYCKLRMLSRPWVICKWAQTSDGYIAANERWISCADSRRHVHRLRGRCDGILVGAGTVDMDDPLLTNRSGQGAQPARVVLDSALRTPVDCRLVRTAGESPVIIATTHQGAIAAGDHAAELRGAGVELLELPAGKRGVDLPALLDELGRREWTYLLVEGGAKVLASFIDARLADELLVYVSPQRLGADAAGLPRFDIEELRSTVAFGETSRKLIGDDTLLRFVLSE